MEDFFVLFLRVRGLSRKRRLAVLREELQVGIFAYFFVFEGD